MFFGLKIVKLPREKWRLLKRDARSSGKSLNEEINYKLTNDLLSDEFLAKLKASGYVNPLSDNKV